MTNKLLFYLILAIFALATAILLLPTFVHGPKKTKRKSAK